MSRSENVVNTLNITLAVILAFAILGIILYEIPKWQVHDVKDDLNRRTLENDYRKTLVQLIGGAFLLVGLYLTYRRIVATEQTAEASLRQAGTAEQGQITERFSRAIDQLASDNLTVRLGGIYSLERIARDSEDDHPTVMEVLTTFVREHAPWSPEERTPEDPSETDQAEEKKAANVSSDIQAILTVIGRRKWFDKEKHRIDLSRTNLQGSYLRKAHLQGSDLREANLRQARLREANLSGAILIKANLSGADLSDANLNQADLSSADLSDANLCRADLSWTSLNDANLCGARNLEAAIFLRARIYGAKFDPGVEVIA